MNESLTATACSASNHLPPGTPRGCCIHELFEAQARKTPEAVAVSDGAERLSYRVLHERSSTLARYLRAAGVKPEVPVALYLERSPLMVVAILGVLKAGGAYVPIDLAYPPERLQFMLEDAQAGLLLTQSGLRSRLPSTKAKVVPLDSDWERIVSSPDSRPVQPVIAENAAYIIYTSGSTGKPKGVVVTHHNVTRLIGQTKHWYGFNPQDVWPLFHSYAFDVSVWELWGCLFNGGRLVTVPYLVTRSPMEFYQLLSREKVTVLNQTPSAFRQLIWAEENSPERLPLALRYVICAGEALELQSLRPWFARHGDQRPKVVNMYGITETTVHSTFRVIRQEDLENGAGSVIGVPIPDLQIHLVDDDLRPVLKGKPGEICVGGEGVARGYLNRPELNAARFLPDPFSSRPGARLYRSGDLAQYNANGELEYLGRMDHQVKIRGFRVELGEIESALNRHPGIQESVVVARDDTGGKQLVAYVVPRNRQLTVSELRAFAGKTLPDYMVPAMFVTLEKLPLTTNGKVDRRALPAPDSTRPDLDSAYVSPRTEKERILAGIWREVLGVQKPGVHDNFFELGGDSIRSISILAQARQAGIAITVQQMFEHPTIEALAAAAGTVTGSEERLKRGSFSLVSPGDRAKLPADAEDAYPVSKLQLGMFFRNELSPESAAYHDVFSYRVEGQFRQELLVQAVHRLVQRHPLLRTSFHLAGYSEPLQVVHREVTAPFTVEDLSHLEASTQHQLLVAWVNAEKRRPFNRELAPLVRFHAQVWRDRLFQFVISFHHSCIDGWSLAEIVQEVFGEYRCSLAGETPNIPAPLSFYRNFVALEKEAIGSAEARAFWSQKVEGIVQRQLPRWPKSYCTPAPEQVRGPEVLLEARVLDGLRRVAQQAGVPLKSVLLAAHQWVMAFLHGQTDVCTGLVSNGRPEEIDGDRVVGLFLNAVPLRMSLTGGTWLELVQQAFAAEQEVRPFRRFPLAEIQRLNRGLPLFETAFDFVHFHVLKGLHDAPDLSVKEGHYFESNDLATYTTFMLDATSTALEVHIDYDPNRIARRQAEAFTAYYVSTLQKMAAEPESRYDSFLPFSQHESRQILEEWNDTAQEYPRTARINELFEARVRQTPGAVAVRDEVVTLTYAELNSRADKLAALLRAVGAKPGCPVGVCLDRSAGMVTALLAVLKAGAPYLPLDPEYPAERLAFMVQDSGADMLLTSRCLLGKIPKVSARCICVEEQHQTAVVTRSPETDLRSSSEDLAYIIYTSGSTGRPKGVAVTHRSVVNLLNCAARLLRVTPRDHLLAVTTLSFDIAALELFLPLVSGAGLTIAKSEICRDGVALAVLMRSSGATLMQATPSTWRLLIESGWLGKEDLRVICGGEALKPDLARNLLRRVAELWDFYGPTETTIWSTAERITSGEHITVGRPLDNTRVYIVDSQMRPVPVGTAGELLIGGDGVSKGYWNRDDLTAEKFVPDMLRPDPGRNVQNGTPHPSPLAFRRGEGESSAVFGVVHGTRASVYRTGDLARFLPDGRIECLGRIDRQVKIRGFRIEPEELERTLREFPGISEVVIAAKEDRTGEKRLIAYLTSNSESGPTSEELRAFARERLPHHMVPAHFVVLKELPLTANGKINVDALPGPEGCLTTTCKYRPPQDALEQGLADIWTEVLEVRQVGLDDNFFELGADSLSATRAFARINRLFASSLSLREVLEQPTIAQLAEIIREHQGNPAVSRLTIPKQPRVFTA